MTAVNRKEAVGELKAETLEEAQWNWVADSSPCSNYGA